MKRLVPYTAEWERLADAEARVFAPRIRPCATCGGPAVDGYVCNRCGCVSPSDPACDCHNPKEGGR